MSLRTGNGRVQSGAATAVKQVAEDTTALVKAEIALAKAELTQGIKAKGMGIGMLVGAAVFGWLALQGLLITLGFALALVMPGWAAALIVSLLLLAGAAGAGLAGRKFLQAPMGIATTKHNVEEDVAWAKSHLPTKDDLLPPNPLRQ